MQDVQRAKNAFVAIWAIATVIKVVIAARLPLFVDEAFYWQEGRHLAAAYSDLPGLTAWLTRVGTTLGGQHVLAVRAPFLLIAALIPWLIAHIARRWFDEAAGWHAGALVVVMPLSGTLGVMALPDVPMALATVLCLDAGARLLREVDAASAAELALGLAIGALSHYRFLGVIGVGFIALLLLPRGRAVLRDPRVWIALAVGVAAWVPLIGWNIQYADAGLRFQLVDRHPWAFQGSGFGFLLIQALFVTPMLFAALLMTAARSFRPGEVPSQWRYFGMLGAVSTLGFFVLGFFADVERVSFHWTLPGYLALIVGVPVLLRTWSPLARRATWAIAALGLVGMLGYYLIVSVPSLREQTASSKYYPYNFAGWNLLADRVREARGRMPPGTQLLVDNFKIGAELGFHLDDPDIRVLDHPLNRKHGRAPQLALWELQSDRMPTQPTLLVISSTDVKLRQLVAHYQSLCARLGPLPAPQVVNADHGGQRFLLFALDGRRRAGPCTTPAIAHINRPKAGAKVRDGFEIDGWAMKEGVGVSAVRVTIDGKPVTNAAYGHADAWIVDEFYGGRARDPNGANIGFRARVDLRTVSPGSHWLGIEIVGADGSREPWAEQRIRVE